MSCSIIRGGIDQNLSITGKIAFFQNFLFSTASRISKNCSYNFQSNCGKFCGPFYTVPWCLWHSMIRGTMGQKHLSPWKRLNFEMFVSIDLLGPWKRSDLLHKKGQNTLWTFIICFRTFDMFDKKKKNKPKAFLHWKVCLFFETLCLQQLFRS